MLTDQVFIMIHQSTQAHVTVCPSEQITKPKLVSWGEKKKPDCCGTSVTLKNIPDKLLDWSVWFWLIAESPGSRILTAQRGWVVACIQVCLYGYDSMWCCWSLNEFGLECQPSYRCIKSFISWEEVYRFIHRDIRDQSIWIGAESSFQDQQNRSSWNL